MATLTTKNKQRLAKLRNPVKFWLGKKRSKDDREKMSIAKRKNPTRYWLGKTREDLTGSKNVHWKGGISKIDKICRRLHEYNKWRSDVFNRDNWTCQTCQLRGYVTAHHIKGFSLIIKENQIKNTPDARKCDELWDIKNGVTLCEDCHKLTDNYKGRAKTTK